MRKIVTGIILLWIPLMTFAQPDVKHRIISFGAGPSFSGSGDVFGTGIYNEYMQTLTKRISFQSKLSFYLISVNDLNSFSLIDQQNGLMLDAGFNISPFKMKKRAVFVSGGGGIRYFADTGISGASIMTSTRQNEEGIWVEKTEYVDFDDFVYYKGMALGWYVGFGYFENIGEHVAIGLKCNFQLYTDGAVIWITGFSLGYDFRK